MLPKSRVNREIADYAHQPNVPQTSLIYAHLIDSLSSHVSHTHRHPSIKAARLITSMIMMISTRRSSELKARQTMDL